MKCKPTCCLPSSLPSRAHDCLPNGPTNVDQSYPSTLTLILARKIAYQPLVLDNDDGCAVGPALGQLGNKDVGLRGPRYFCLVVHNSGQQVRQDAVDPRRDILLDNLPISRASRLQTDGEQRTLANCSS